MTEDATAVFTRLKGYFIAIMMIQLGLYHFHCTTMYINLHNVSGEVAVLSQWALITIDITCKAYTPSTTTSSSPIQHTVTTRVWRQSQLGLIQCLGVLQVVQVHCPCDWLSLSTLNRIYVRLRRLPVWLADEWGSLAAHLIVIYCMTVPTNNSRLIL